MNARRLYQAVMEIMIDCIKWWKERKDLRTREKKRTWVRKGRKGGKIAARKGQGRNKACPSLHQSIRVPLFFVFLFKSCIHLFSAEPDRAKLTRDKELACIRNRIWRKQTLCETSSYRPKEKTQTPQVSLVWDQPHASHLERKENLLTTSN